MGTDTVKFTNHPYEYVIVPGSVVYKFRLYYRDKDSDEEWQYLRSADQYDKLVSYVNELKKRPLGEIF